MSRALIRFETIIEKLRDLDTEMQMQAAMTLSIVARVHQAGGDITVKEIGEKLGLSSASASRNIAVLSEWNRHDLRGHNLVQTIENPKKRVEKFVRLTKKGEKFIYELENIVDGKTPDVDVLVLGESPNKQRHKDKMAARKEDNMRSQIVKSYIENQKLSKGDASILQKLCHHMHKNDEPVLDQFYGDLVRGDSLEMLLDRTGYKPEPN